MLDILWFITFCFIYVGDQIWLSQKSVLVFNHIIYELVDRFGNLLRKAEVNFTAPDIVKIWHHVHDGLKDIDFIPSMREREGFF